MLLFFDDTSEAFLGRVKALAFNILREAFGVQTRRERFEFGGLLVPLEFVVFEGDSKLGFFDRSSYRLGINKKLMLSANEKILKDVITHELAHLFTLLHHGSNVNPHGAEFKLVCQFYGLAPEVQAATLNFSAAMTNEEVMSESVALQSERIISKVKKLLSLASSSNQHESELATLKANQMLRDYNLSKLTLEQKQTPTYLKRVLEAPKRNAKLQAIYEILTTFHVCVVFNQGRGRCALEVCGDRTNVELADYVAAFLDLELDRSWQDAKTNNPELKGALAKNSFFRGLAKGYLAKHKGLTAKESTQGLQAKDRELALLKQDLELHTARAFPKLSKISSRVAREHKDSHQSGMRAGSSLSIRAGLKNNSGATKLLGN